MSPNYSITGQDAAGAMRGPSYSISGGFLFALELAPTTTSTPSRRSSPETQNPLTRD